MRDVWKLNNAQRPQEQRAQQETKKHRERLEKCNLQLKNKNSVSENQIHTLKSTINSVEHKVNSLLNDKEGLEKIFLKQRKR